MQILSISNFKSLQAGQQIRLPAFLLSSLKDSYGNLPSEMEVLHPFINGSIKLLIEEKKEFYSLDEIEFDEGQPLTLRIPLARYSQKMISKVSIEFTDFQSLERSHAKHISFSENAKHNFAEKKISAKAEKSKALDKSLADAIASLL